MQFQEDFLGKNVQKTLMTRIPVRCFLDFKPGGALCHMLLTAFRFRSEHNLRRFEIPTTKASAVRFFLYKNQSYKGSLQ